MVGDIEGGDGGNNDDENTDNNNDDDDDDEEDRIEREEIRKQNEKAQEIEKIYLQEQQEKKQEKVNNVMRRISGGLVLPCENASTITPPPTHISKHTNCADDTSVGSNDKPHEIDLVIVIEKVFCIIDVSPNHALFSQLVAIVANEQRSLGSLLSSDMNLSHNKEDRHKFLSSCMYVNIGPTSVTLPAMLQLSSSSSSASQNKGTFFLSCFPE